MLFSQLLELLRDFADVVEVEEERVGRGREAQGLLDQLHELALQRLVGVQDALELLRGQQLEVVHDFLPEAQEVADLGDERDLEVVQPVLGLLVDQEARQLPVVLLDRGKVLDHRVLLGVLSAVAYGVVELF